MSRMPGAPGARPTEVATPSAHIAGRARTPCRTLAEYVTGLVDGLGAGAPDSLARMREVVGSRRARVVLGPEAVDVGFEESGGISVAPAAPGTTVDGEGSTDRRTVLEILDGYLEVTDAILEGHLDARGSVEDVARMFVAIEIFLDAATRVPALQSLARDYRSDPCLEAAGPPPRPAPARVSLAGVPTQRRMALLRRLDLLP